MHPQPVHLNGRTGRQLGKLPGVAFGLSLSEDDSINLDECIAQSGMEVTGFVNVLDLASQALEFGFEFVFA